MSTGVGLVGAGRVARLHVAALRELGIPLIGVVSSSPARAAAAARSWEAEGAFEDLDALVRDPRVDTVHIATPSALHADQVDRVLRAGKHVVCEKPLSTTAARSHELAALAEERGLVGAVAYTYRFHPVVAALRARVPALGDLRLVRMGYLQDWLLGADATEWRLDPTLNGPSRVLADIGSHAIDLIEHVTGDRVSAVSATVSSVLRATGGAGADDIAVASFELAGGAVGSLEVSQVAVGHTNTVRLELSGVDASAAIDLRDRMHVWHAEREGNGLERVPLPAMHGAPTGTDADYLAAYVAFILAVRAAVAGVSDGVLPTFADCHRAHVVRDAVQRAARERAWVDIRASAEPPPGASTEPDAVTVTL